MFDNMNLRKNIKEQKNARRRIKIKEIDDVAKSVSDEIFILFIK